MVKSEYPTKSGQEALHENSSLFTLRSSLITYQTEHYSSSAKPASYPSP